MIDRKARRDAGLWLRRLALGRATNMDFDANFPWSSGDPVIYALYETTWGFCDDSREHSLREAFRKGTETRKRLVRWLLFLKTDIEYGWPAKGPHHPGARDLYRPSLFSRMTGVAWLTRVRTVEFQRHGEYGAWPFLSYAQLEAVAGRHGRTSL
jgi:hypothetical protein